MKKLVKSLFLALLVLTAVWGVLKTIEYPDRAPGAYTYPLIGGQPVLSAVYCASDFGEPKAKCTTVLLHISPTIGDLVVPSCPRYIVEFIPDNEEVFPLYLEKGSCKITWIQG